MKTMLLLAALLLAGCAETVHYRVTDETRQQFYRDRYECERDTADKWRGEATNTRRLDYCMTARGWERIEP